jgi:hypothetical protein
MARDEIIFMRANPFRGQLDGVGLKIKTFLGPEMATSQSSANGTKKVEIFRAYPFQWPE